MRKNQLKTLNLRELVDTIDELINHQYAEDMEYVKDCMAKGTKLQCLF